MDSINDLQKLMRTQLATRFNIILSEFILSLIDTYPHDAIKLTKAYSKLQLVLIATPAMPLTEFASRITPEIDQLVSNNNEDLFELDAIKSNTMMKDLCILSNWDITPKETREVIWSYLGAFASLSMTYNGIASHSDVDIDNIADAIQKVSSDIISELDQDQDVQIPELFRSVAHKLGVDCNDLDMSTFDDDLKSVHDMLTDGKTTDTSDQMRNFIRDQVNKSTQNNK